MPILKRHTERPDYSHLPVWDRPLAAVGLTSYRCRGSFGWIMIGANSIEGAWRSALRSSQFADRNTLQVWNGREYVDAE